MAMTYIQQNGTIGKSIKYPNKRYPNATIATSGCGVCSSLMVLLNSTTYSIKLAEWTKKLIFGGARALEGTDMTAVAKILKKDYGFNYTITSDISKLKAHLKKGYKAVCNVGQNGYFSSGGHYVCAAGITKNGKAIILDPYYYTNKWTSTCKGVNRSKYFKYNAASHELICNFSTISSDARGNKYYLFTPTKKITISYSSDDINYKKTTKTSQKTNNSSSKPTFKVGNTYTLTTEVKVRTGAGTNYAQKKRSQLTSNGQKNALNQTYAVLKSGTKFTVQKVKENGSDIWIKIPSGWICAYYRGDKYAK